MKWKPSQSPLSSVQLRQTPERFEYIMGLSVSDFDALLQRLGDTTNEPQRSSAEKLAEEVSIALLFMRQSMSQEVLSVCFGIEEAVVGDIVNRLPSRLEATQAPHHKSSSAIRSRKHLLDSQKNKIEAERLLHELQVHQVELQAQNEELITWRAETEEQLLRYTKLYEFAPMGYFTVLRDGAIIQKANLAAERLMGLPRREIINQPFVRFIEEESRVVVHDLLKKAFARATDDEPEGCEVKMLTDENKPFWAHIRTIVSADRQFCRIVVLDIRVIKENEEALRKSEAVFRSALQSLSEGVVVHDAASVIQLCNPQAEQILGLTVEQMKGRTSLDPRWRSVHEDGSPFHGENHPVPITLKTGMSQHNVIMGVHKPDGSLNWISINAEPIIFEGETEIRGAIATFTDITERKRAQEELRVKEQRFRSFVELQGTYFLCTDLAGNYTYASPAHIRTFGMGKTSLIGLNGLQHIIPEDHAKTERTVEQCLQNPSTPVSVVLRKPSTSGEILWTEWEFITVTDAKGVVAEIQCIGHDITERNRTEEHYLRSNQLLEESQSIAKVGGWELDIGSSHLYWTAETYRIHETSPEEFNPTVDAGVGYFLPDSKRQISAALELAITEGKGYDLTLETYTTKGRLIHVRTTCKVISIDGKPITLTGIFQDITEQKKSEQVLKDSEQRLGLALEGGNLGLWDWDALTNTLIVNERWLSMLGLNPLTTIPTLDFWHSLVHPEDMPILQNQIDKVISNPNGKRVEAEVRAKHANGEYIWILDKGVIVSRDNNGNPLRIAGTHMDITERKTAEKKISLLQQKYLAILNAANGIVWEADAQTFQFTFVSGQAEAILGYPIHRWTEEPTFWKDHIHPEDRTWAVDYCLNCILKNQAHDFEYRMIAADGRVVWLHDIVTVESENGKPVLLRGLMVDITYRKQAEAALENVLKRLELAIHAANIGIWEYGINDSSLIWDDQMYALYGISKTTFNVTYEAWRTGLHPEDGERSEHELEVAIAGGKDFDTEFRVVWPDQSIHHIRAFATVIFDAFGKAIKVIGANYDITERKEIINELVRAKEKAEESEHRLVIAQGVTKVGSWETDLQTLEVVWSEETYKIFGTDHLSFQASHPAFLEFVHPEDKEKVDKAFLESFTKTGINVVEHRILTVGNSVKHVEERWQIHSDLNGKPTRAVGTCQDITERKLIENELKITKQIAEESEGRLIIAQGVAKVGSWELDLKTNEVVWTEELYKMYGFDPTLPPPPFAEHRKLFTPESWEQLSTSLALAMEQGIPYELELTTIRKDGNHGGMWVRGEAVFDENKNIIGLMGVSQDITERKRAEEVLRESELRWKFAIEGSGDGLWDWNVLKSTVFFTKRWKEMLGFAEDEIGSGLDEWSKRVHPDDLEHTLADVQAHLDGRTSNYVSEHRVSCKDGTWKWILDRGLVISRDADGKPLRMIGTHTDITERKRAEEEIRLLNTELEERVIKRTEQLAALNAELEAFSYSVSHDLRAPLRAMSGFGSLLAKGYADTLDEEGNLLLGKVNAAAKRMGILIDNLLAFSRMGRQAMTITMVDMHSLVTAVWKELAEATDISGFTITIEPLAAASCDAALMRQVWHNLLSNAIKYSSKSPIKQIRVSSFIEKRQTVYRVEDQGVGFAMEYADKLFQPFQRLHGNDEFEGTGIGLAIVRQIIKRHGGTVEARAEVGKGATMEFRF